jgi:hypothetical protein
MMAHLFNRRLAFWNTKRNDHWEALCEALCVGYFDRKFHPYCKVSD